MHAWKVFCEKKGAVAILVGASIVVFLGIAAFAIDFGFAWVTNNELQNIADGAALAGARQLGRVYCPEPADPTLPRCLTSAQQQAIDVSGDLAAIHAVVKDVASKNTAMGKSIAINDGDIQVGIWDYTKHSLVVSNVAVDINGDGTKELPNAVSVTARRDTSANDPIPTFFGRIYNVSSISLAKPATAALTGLGHVAKGEIQVPLGVSKDRDCSNPVITLQKTGTSCAGWTSFLDTNTSNSNMKDIIDGMRTNTVQAPAANIGDTFYYNGGTQSGVFLAFYNLYMAKRDPATRDWQVVLPVYDDNGASCSNPNGGLKIVGFATMTFSDPNPAISSDDPIGCTASDAKEPIKTCPLSQDIMRGTLVCMVQPGRGGGTDDWAIGDIPGLVQ
jgi:Putative Flp pilus-assembly TadE/G-like